MCTLHGRLSGFAEKKTVFVCNVTQVTTFICVPKIREKKNQYDCWIACLCRVEFVGSIKKEYPRPENALVIDWSSLEKCVKWQHFKLIRLLRFYSHICFSASQQWKFKFNVRMSEAFFFLFFRTWNRVRKCCHSLELAEWRSQVSETQYIGRRTFGACAFRIVHDQSISIELSMMWQCECVCVCFSFITFVRTK